MSMVCVLRVQNRICKKKQNIYLINSEYFFGNQISRIMATLKYKVNQLQGLQGTFYSHYD